MKPHKLPAALMLAGVLGSAVAAAAPPRTLDLRPTDPLSLKALDSLQTAPPADLDEAQDVAIVGTPLPPDESSDIHLTRAGLGSLYWAARHPGEAWTVLLPITPSDGSTASEDMRFRCAIFAKPPSGRAACP
jgi:hypothetical protein